MKVSERVNELVNYFGGLRRLARAYNMDVSYLSRLWSGEKSNPGPTVLKKLGLVKIVDYKKADALTRQEQ